MHNCYNSILFYRKIFTILALQFFFLFVFDVEKFLAVIYIRNYFQRNFKNPFTIRSLDVKFCFLNIFIEQSVLSFPLPNCNGCLLDNYRLFDVINSFISVSNVHIKYSIHLEKKV